MLILPLASARWTFRDATKRTPWRRAVVPGCVHRDLLRHGLIPDPFWGTNELQLQWIEEHDWEYRATFAVTDAILAEEIVELVADGLDTVATIMLNGARVADTENMFIGHRWDVKRLLRRGRNELSVRFDSAMRYIRTQRTGHTPREFNDPVGGCTRLRKQQCQFGWDWGPRFVTAGIWRDIRLEAWSGNRVENVRVMQTHHVDRTQANTSHRAGARAPLLKGGNSEGSSPLEGEGPRTSDLIRSPLERGGPRASAVGCVTLEFAPELARPDPDATIRGTISLDGRTVAEISNSRAEIPDPQLWWPNDQGGQPLYIVHLEILDGRGAPIGSWSRRIGLRTIVLDRHADEWGETFQFVVNGRPIFAKGANWIPAHSFVAGLTRDDYTRDLRAARDAHMNMLRVWGGGVYESEDFYDLCDELGLLVWQDFMFACTLYPGDDAFLASSRDEANYQVRRLRHRACLALWCGNNEIWALNQTELTADPEKRRDYEKLFHETLPAAVAAHDGGTGYRPSSPWRGDEVADHAAGEARGDTHFWDVWHARHPVRDYERHKFRFVSEFGMQSFASVATQATFCPPADANIFGATMTNHQKNRAGNQIILDYVSRLYRFPKSQDDLIYLSQLNQAHCMQVGVEHYRRNMPRCMGALYWQLNDCWPVASWSSIEFTGRWRALHHLARRFFAPAIVSAHVPGEECDIIGNYRRSTVNEVIIHTVYDAPAPTTGRVLWDLFHVDGRKLLRGHKRVELQPGESVAQHTLRLEQPLRKFSRDELYVRIALELDRPASGRNRGVVRRVSEETVFLTAPRFVSLPRARTRIGVRMKTPRHAVLMFSSRVFQHRCCFELPGVLHRASDNFFELYPGERKIVDLELSRPMIATQLKQRLIVRSLVDSY